MSMTKSMLFHMGGVPAASGIPFPFKDGQVWFVDGTNGSDTYNGKSLEAAKATIQAALTACAVGDVVLVWPKEMAQTDTDPGSYAENLTMDTPQVALIGVERGLTQGGLPQCKVGATTTSPLLNIRAPGCVVRNMGFNGVGGTGGGILLTDDGGATYAAFGVTIEGCHFKNCVGTTATSGATGGAIMWTSSGNAWQIRVARNVFYKNVGDIIMKGTGGSIPQDVQIEWNRFSGPKASVDVHIYTAADGINGLYIDRNIFPELPTIGSATIGRFLSLAGSVGMLTNNVFGCVNTLTFKAASMGTAGWVPATMFMANNWGQDCTTPFVHTS